MSRTSHSGVLEKSLMPKSYPEILVTGIRGFYYQELYAGPTGIGKKSGAAICVCVCARAHVCVRVCVYVLTLGSPMLELLYCFP